MLNEYKDWCYEPDQILNTLGQTNVSQNDFQADWAKKVATKFNLDETQVASIYSYSTDQWNTNSNTRYMWKDNCAKSVTGTPVVFINGVQLDSAPETVEEWMSILNSVYNS